MSENNEILLPTDLKAFFQISDGMNVSWKVKMNKQECTLGCLSISRLREICPIDSKTNFLINPHCFNDSSEESSNSSCSDSDLEEDDKLVVKETAETKLLALDIDKSCTNGKVALVYCFNKREKSNC